MIIATLRYSDSNLRILPHDEIYIRYLYLQFENFIRTQKFNIIQLSLNVLIAFLLRENFSQYTFNIKQ